MKSHLLAALLPLVAATAMAQDAFQAPALIIEENGAYQQVWLTKATKTSFRYKTTKVATDFDDAKIADFKSIFIYQPTELTEARDLFEARKYAEAKPKFAAVRERFEPLATLANNPSTLAGYFEMECLRKLNDLEGLSAALQKFAKKPLTREYQLRQLELYIIWDAVRTQSWDRVEILVREREESRLPGFQRAQVAYLHGLTLEALERPANALNAYQTAMIADTGASEVITRNSALRVLAIHSADPDVQTAIEVWGTDDENKNSRGYGELLQAGATARMFELSLGAGEKLPEEYKKFLKFELKQPAQ